MIKPSNSNFWQSIINSVKSGWGKKKPALPKAKKINCRKVWELMDQYADLMVLGQDPRVLLPDVYQHLLACPKCKEELQALIRAIEADK